VTQVAEEERHGRAEDGGHERRGHGRRAGGGAGRRGVGRKGDACERRHGDGRDDDEGEQYLGVHDAVNRERRALCCGLKGECKNCLSCVVRWQGTNAVRVFFIGEAVRREEHVGSTFTVNCSH
jgi:hypothetical protein